MKAGMKLNQVKNGDCIKELKKVPASSIPLVFADPPFNIWENVGDCVDKTAQINELRCLSISLACCFDDERQVRSA